MLTHLPSPQVSGLKHPGEGDKGGKVMLKAELLTQADLLKMPFPAYSSWVGEGLDFYSLQ